MLDLSIRDLRLLKTVQEQGNLTRAAEVLCVSQSALSHQLKKIERLVGMPIFKRNLRQMAITSAGLLILDSSEHIFIELEKLQQDLNNLNNGTSGTIRISTECYTCYHWLPPLIIAFEKKYPLAQIQIISEATRRPISYLEKAKLDVAIVSDVPDVSKFKTQHLFSDEMVVVLSKQHPLAHKKKLLPQDFENQTMILYDVEDDNLFFLREIIKPNKIKLKQVMKLELTEAIIEMIAAGIGIGVMANWAVAGYLDEKNLVTMSIPKKKVHRNWYAATLKENHQPILGNFISFLEKWQF